MSDTDREALHLIGGPFDGGQVQLTETPLHIDIDGVRYKRLDDPNTGEFLGAYGMSHEEQVETSARIMTGERDQSDSELWQLLTDFARRVIANRDAVLRALQLREHRITELEGENRRLKAALYEADRESTQRIGEEVARAKAAERDRDLYMDAWREEKQQRIDAEAALARDQLLREVAATDEETT